MCPVLIACDTVQIEARSSLMQAVISVVILLALGLLVLVEQILDCNTNGNSSVFFLFV